VLVGAEAKVAAGTLTADAHIGASRNGAASVFNVWARSTDGDLLRHDDLFAPTLDGGTWINHGKPNGVAIGDKGVAATSIDASGGTRQEVFYVGADGNLYQGEKTQFGSSFTWTSWPAPSGKTLTGHIATTGFYSGAWNTSWVYVAATTTDNKLYLWTRVVGGGSATWTNVGGSRSWNTDSPIASTEMVAFNGFYMHFFAAHTSAGQSRLGVLRFSWNPSFGVGSWATLDRGTGSYSMCSSIAAAHGEIASGLYRLFVVCSPTDPLAERVHYGWTSSPTVPSISWITAPMSDTIPLDRGARPNGTYVALDLYHMTDVDSAVANPLQRSQQSDLPGPGLDEPRRRLELVQPPHPRCDRFGSRGPAPPLQAPQRAFYR
jgi:hypothetical protein